MSFLALPGLTACSSSVSSNTWAAFSIAFSFSDTPIVRRTMLTTQAKPLRG
ncbi:MAG: hypothetical protein JW957_04800 [Candidatus Omnitrophica bacterium]|nr:hypothetical protein [Candidatus Omnitrophota bacterium]